MKRYIPHRVKVRLHLIRRLWRDIQKGHYYDYAKQRDANPDLKHALQLKQELKPNEAKMHNLLIAIKRIESIQVNPNEIFSFWNAVGNPNRKNGFVNSRSIVAGVLQDTVGGGLCQLSGLIYYLSLQANLEILERHSHSMDIYTAETRFAPLGSDATVAYGYKDLRIRNKLNYPIRFKFSILENDIIINLMHPSPIDGNKVEFEEKIIRENLVEVYTSINNERVTTSKYKKLFPQ